MNYSRIEMFVNALQVASKSNIYIAGAGKYGQILGQYFDKYGISWEGYVDKNPKLQNVNRKPVYAYGETKDGYYVVSTFSFRKEIEEELKKREIRSEKIITYDDQEIFYDIYDDLIDWKRYIKKTNVFYKQHEKKKCFIIGNGPSLKIKDLEKLRKEVTFASNTIYALYKNTDWRPTYYCAEDPVFCKHMMSDKDNMVMLASGCKAVFTSIMGEGIQYREDTSINNLYFIRLFSKGLSKKFPDFSTDCSEKIYTSGTVTYTMLQLAAYMGFDQIYLLGMDFNYSVERHNDSTIMRNDVCNHMSEIEEEETRFYDAVTQAYGMPYVADVDLQLAGYQKAKQYADAHGIKIYNATRGGKLEVFPRVDFDSLFD